MNMAAKYVVLSEYFVYTKRENVQVKQMLTLCIMCFLRFLQMTGISVRNFFGSGDRCNVEVQRADEENCSRENALKRYVMYMLCIFWYLT